MTLQARIRITLGLLLLIVLALHTSAQPPDREAGGVGTAAAPTRNAALQYWMAFAQMQNPPGEALAGELARVEAGDTPFDDERHGPILDANAEALSTLRRASRVVACDWGVETELGPYAPVAHLAKARALARLNTLDAIRRLAAGQVDAAVERWVAGVRVSQHVAAGGSLLATLSGSTALRSTLAAIGRASATGALTDAHRRTLREALLAVPEDGFEWDRAWRWEQDALETWMAQSAPEVLAQAAGGAPATPIDATHLAAFQRFMARGAEALAQPTGAAAVSIATIEQERAGLHPVLAGLIPSLARVDEWRRQLEDERARILGLLS
jgi:hypothetical protein